MTLTIEYLKKYFDLFNAKYFYSALPVPEFELTHTKSLAGQFRSDSEGSYKIRITRAYEGPGEFFLCVLLHEMIHFYLHVVNDEDKGYRWAHGANFMREAARINKDGWNIQRLVPEEFLPRLTPVRIDAPKVQRQAHYDVFSVLTNPMDECQLIHLILFSKARDKVVLIWFSYPVIQRMIYSQMNEDDHSPDFQKQRVKAILKAYKLLIDFHRGNDYNLYVLHNDAMHFCQSIADSHAADLHRIEMKKYEGSADSTATILVIHGIVFKPIKMWESEDSCSL